MQESCNHFSLYVGTEDDCMALGVPPWVQDSAGEDCGGEAVKRKPDPLGVLVTAVYRHITATESALKALEQAIGSLPHNLREVENVRKRGTRI